jgi:hypothetical protein
MDSGASRRRVLRPWPPAYCVSQLAGMSSRAFLSLTDAQTGGGRHQRMDGRRTEERLHTRWHAHLGPASRLTDLDAADLIPSMLRRSQRIPGRRRFLVVQFVWLHLITFMGQDTS